MIRIMMALVVATSMVGNGSAAEPKKEVRAQTSGELESNMCLHCAGKRGKPGSGKKIVLIAWEQECRSEESLPMLARLLSEHHGFDCTVLFSVNPQTGFYDPSLLNNIPGLQKLDDADLLILSIRFLNPEGEQQRMLTDYLRSGVFLGGAILGNRSRQPVLYIAQSWGGTEKHKPLMDKVLEWRKRTSPKLHPDPTPPNADDFKNAA